MAGNDLGSLLGGLLGGQGGSGAAGGGAGNILGALLGALMGGGAGGGSGGGAGGGAGGGQAAGRANDPLGGLLDMLTKSGLADQAQSWIGTGENQPVNGAQVKEALPDNVLQQAAQQAGVSPDEAAGQLAHDLPQAVDKLTPAGQVPTESLEDIIRKQIH